MNPNDEVATEDYASLDLDEDLEWDVRAVHDNEWVPLEIRSKEMDIDAQVEAEVRKRLAEEKVQEKLRLVERIGEDVFDVGTVFKFRKRFSSPDKVYDYAAIKAGDGKWYTTGPMSKRGYDWEEFVLWLVSGIPATRLVTMVEAK